MAPNKTGLKVVETEDSANQDFIKTFDCCDDPLVYTIQRYSYYDMDSTICGVFDSPETVQARLTKLMDSPRDGEKFIIETHQLRSHTMETE